MKIKKREISILNYINQVFNINEFKETAILGSSNKIKIGHLIGMSFQRTGPVFYKRQ